MSNERRNPYYKKKNHKNMSSLSAAAGGTQAGAARTNESTGTSSLLRAAGGATGNATITTMECETNPTELDLNESMISTVSSINPQDLDATPSVTTQTTTTINPYRANNNLNQTTTTTNNTSQIGTNVTNTTPTSAITTRTMLVDNISPVNPNDVETFAIRTRQQQRGTNFRSAPATPVVSQPYTHIGYFDIKVKLERSDDPWDELIGATKDIFIQLWKMDPSIKIFVYEKSERIKDPSFIANAADFRKVNFFCFDKYFFRGAPLPLGGSRTLNVLMTYTVDFNTIMKQIGPIMMGMKCGVFMRTLQAEKTTTIGWAYMSTKNTNKQALAEAIIQKIRIPVGLQWRVITTGMSGGEIKEDEKVRAIHFEVEDCDIQYAKRILNEMYHHSQTEGFPLEMKFRFMPLFANIPNTEGQNNLMTMIGFQRRYCRYLGEYLNGDIMNVDGRLPNGITIRQYLMNIRVDEDRRKRLFQGINKTWNNRGYVYSILPKHRDLASVTIQHLLTKLHFDFPEASEDGKVFPDIDRFFDAVAWERAQETTWDAQKNCAVAINLDNLQGTIDAMKGEDFFETFYEQDEDKVTKEKKDDDSTDKEKLMIDTDGRSIATRTKASRRSEGTSNRGTPNIGARVSFGDSVASPMTVEGLTTAGSVLTMEDLQSIVATTVVPIVTDIVEKKNQQQHDNINGLASMIKQMQENQNSFQLQQQQNHQHQQQLQQQQQQQIQLQLQQLQQLQLQQQQQLLQQQHPEQYQYYQQNTNFAQDVQVMDTSLYYHDGNEEQIMDIGALTQQQHQHQHQHQQQQPQNQQLQNPLQDFSAAHPMEGEQHPP
jgi:hypothetical protein